MSSFLVGGPDKMYKSIDIERKNRMIKLFEMYS